MINAIVYTSNSGFTAQYAKILSEKVGLEVYSAEAALKQLPAGSAIIYLGWLMASSVAGYKKAAGRYKIAAVCGVGMGASGSQLDEMRKASKIPNSVPVFSVQGGFDITRLHGIYKFMMLCMKKTAGKSLAKKEFRTPDEDDMLALLLHGGSRVDADNLRPLIDWYETAK